MPIYEYKCKKCDNEFELLLYYGEIPVCPKCNSQDLTKKISMFAMSYGKSKDNASSERSYSNSSCRSCSGKSCATCK